MKLSPHLVALAGLAPLLCAPADALPAPQEPAGNPWDAQPPKTVRQRMAEAESALLAQVEQSFLAGLYTMRPWLARELGREGWDERLGDFTLAGQRGWLRRIGNLSRRLPAVGEQWLSPERGMDRDLLHDWLHVAGILGATQPWLQRDPSWYVENVHRSLRSFSAAAPLSPERLDTLTVLLEQVPGAFEAARANLNGPEPRWVLLAQELSLELIAYLGVELPLLYGPLLVELGEERAEACMQAREEAEAALLAYVRWLQIQAPRNRPEDWALDPEVWMGVVDAASGSELTLKQLKLRLLRDIADLDHAIRAGGNGGELREPVPPQQLLADLQRGLDLARSVGVAGKLVAPAIPDPQLAARFLFARSSPRIAMRAQAGGDWLLELGVPNPLWSAQVGATGRRLSTRPALEAAGIRFGAAGESAARLYLQRGGAGVRGALVNPATIGGYGLFAGDALGRMNWAENELVEREDVLVELARQRLIEAARLYAALQLHGEHSDDFQDIVGDFADQSGFDPESAELEVLRAVRNPLHGVQYLGYIEFLRLEAVGRENGGSAIQALRLAMVLGRKHPTVRPADMIRHHDFSVW